MTERWTLRTIIEQLEACQYECDGGSLANNVAWKALKTMSFEFSNDTYLPVAFYEVRLRDGTVVMATRICGDFESMDGELLSTVQFWRFARNGAFYDPHRR